MSLTRRDVLGGAVAAGAGVLLGPVAARAAAGGPPVFTRSIGALDGARPATIAPGRPFTLAGVQWSAPAVPRIELRTRRADGTWGPWGAASGGAHDPSGREGAGARGGRFGEPVWTGRAAVLQLRSDGPVSGVRVHLVAAEPPGAVIAADVLAAAPPPLATPVLPAGPGQPPIIARAAWAGRGHRPSAGPGYGDVQLAFVHHTDNPNGYARADVPAMLRAIYSFHRFTRGWFDIGYNFVIDAFGRVWEAREGGIDEPVIGAQAGAYNAESTGVAVLGTFSSAVPPPAAMAALERLLAWKLSLHGVPARGHVRVEVDPADAFYTRFRPGQHVLLPRVAGHRDGDLTDCPGDALYHRLPDVRGRVAALAGTPARLTLTASARLTAGAALAVSGRLTQGGRPLAGAQVALQAIGAPGPAGAMRPQTLATLTTDAAGHWAASPTLTRTTRLRALHAARPAAASAEVIAVQVAPAIALTLAATSPPRVTGTVSPGAGRVTVDVYRLVGGRRHRVSQTRVAARGGAFSLRPRLRGRGSYVIVARTVAGARYAAGASAPLRFTV